MRLTSCVISSCLSLVFLCGCATRPKPLCSGLTLKDSRIQFDDSEQKLLCGDPSNPAWNSIPRQQVIYHLKTFLLERGFYNPHIEENPERLIVDPGPRAIIQRFEVNGWPSHISHFPERRHLKLHMTPATLDEIEISAATFLKGQGYPCPKVTTTAYPLDELVVISVQPGLPQKFGKAQVIPAEDIDARTLKRFEAFRAEELYDYKLLELTERRIRSSGLVQDVSYYPECDPGKEFGIRHRTLSGDNRFFSIGAGFDTEELAIAQARLSFNRLTRKGSSLETLAYASLRRQALTNTGKLHLWPPESRTHLYGEVEVEHRNENKYDTLRTSFRPGIGTSIEQPRSKFDFKFGPKAEYIKIYRGVGLEDTRNISLEASVVLTSHLFEYYLNSPREGYRLGFGIENASDVWGSTFSASKVHVLAESLWKLYEDRNLDLIWGIRSFVDATYSHNGSDERSAIPPSFKSFLGGSQNLRGFSREELPKGRDGAFSAYYLGTELRLARLSVLEPLIFGDFGVLAQDTFEFEAPLYLSPGIGLRWQLPFGSLRGTAAYGWSVAGGDPSQYSAHPQFFLSFGEEF